MLIEFIKWITKEIESRPLTRPVFADILREALNKRDYLSTIINVENLNVPLSAFDMWIFCAIDYFVRSSAEDCSEFLKELGCNEIRIPTKKDDILSLIKELRQILDLVESANINKLEVTDGMIEAVNFPLRYFFKHGIGKSKEPKETVDNNEKEVKIDKEDKESKENKDNKEE